MLKILHLLNKETLNTDRVPGCQGAGLGQLSLMRHEQPPASFISILRALRTGPGVPGLVVKGLQGLGDQLATEFCGPVPEPNSAHLWPRRKRTFQHWARRRLERQSCRLTSEKTEAQSNIGAFAGFQGVGDGAQGESRAPGFPVLSSHFCCPVAVCAGVLFLSPISEDMHAEESHGLWIPTGLSLSLGSALYSVTWAGLLDLCV